MTGSGADWRERLRERGYRLTPQRELILGAVEQLGHATPEEVLAEVRTHSTAVNASTVYRTLEVLERRRLLTRMHLDGYHGYTVCDDGHHHHLLCRSCGRVATVDARGVEAEIHKLAGQLDFRVDTHTLEFSGLCQSCQAEAVPVAGPPAPEPVVVIATP